MSPGPTDAHAGSGPPLLDLFDRVYVINLPSRTDRRREMARQLQRIGLGFEHPCITLFPAIRPATADGFPTVGTRGCFLSHLAVLDDALARGLQRVLLLEDDLDFDADFAARWSAVAPQLRALDWQLFHGDHRISAPPAAAAGAGLGRAGPHDPVVLADFVGFQGAAIGAAVECLQAILQRPPGHPEGGPMHVDGAYNLLRQRHPAWHTLLAQPPLGRQRASRTDIHALRWYDAMVGVRHVAAWARRRKNA